MQESPDRPLTDPFAIKALSKLHPSRLVWTLYSRSCELFARLNTRSIRAQLDPAKLEHFYGERGSRQDNTKFTTNKTRLLVDAVAATTDLVEPIVEIGSYRGATTAQLAGHTKRVVYAVDPYIGYGGWEEDQQYLFRNCDKHRNIVPLRITSGQALTQFHGPDQISLAVIDAVNDYVNAWYNFRTWARVVRIGGLIALNSVDDSPGPNLVCRRLLHECHWLKPWGYCPDLIIFRKLGSEQGGTRS